MKLMKHGLIGVCFLLTISFLPQTACSQDDAPFNKMAVQVMVPLQFSYISAMDMLQKKIIEHAVELRLKVKQEDVKVTAQLLVDGMSGNEEISHAFTIKMVANTSPDVVSSPSFISLSAVPVPLFFQPRTLLGTKHYSYYFSLVLNPLQNVLPPGRYYFTLLFTLTPQ